MIDLPFVMEDEKKKRGTHFRSHFSSEDE